MTSGDPSDQTRIIRRRPEAGARPPAVPAPGAAPLAAPPPCAAPPVDPSAQQTGIIRRHPTGAFPAQPPADEPETSFIPSAAKPTPAPTSGPGAASVTAAVSILGGWATAVIATSLISGWWSTDRLFCVAIGFLTAVSASGTIGGLISLLLRRRIGRLLIVVGAIVALMIFAGLFVAGAQLPQIVYAIPVLLVASVVLALLPATGRWCR